eukprot:13699548-Ditylum_brightwellii.AAC.2
MMMEGKKTRRDRKKVLMERKKASKEKRASNAERKRKGAGYRAGQKEGPSCKKEKKTSKKRASKGDTAEKVYNDGISRPSYINIGSSASEFEPIVDVASPAFDPRATS